MDDSIKGKLYNIAHSVATKRMKDEKREMRDQR